MSWQTFSNMTCLDLYSHFYTRSCPPVRRRGPHPAPCLHGMASASGRAVASAALPTGQEACRQGMQLCTAALLACALSFTPVGI